MVDQINQLIKHKSVLEIQGSVLQHEIAENSGRMSFDQEQQMHRVRATAAPFSCFQDTGRPQRCGPGKAPEAAR